MAQNSLNITSDNITEWLASTGFIFPRTILELSRFEKLYGDVQIDLTGCEIDPDVILGIKQKANIISLSSSTEELKEPKFRMAARKNDSNIPKHILDQIKKNQDKENRMILELRKKNLRLAAIIADEFTSENITQLALIAQSESISTYYDHYEDSFDGMLVCDEENKFHIHLNLDRGNSDVSSRGRFSFAHELAHYFIDEHRIPLITGQATPHGSLHDFEHRDIAQGRG